jgi:hypothetical protein
MKIYFACPTGKRRDGIVENYGDKFGACLTRDTFNNVTANKMPWFLDNGAFSDYKQGKVFNSTKFYNRLLEVELKVRRGVLDEPDFVVVPDVVGEGLLSMKRSIDWIEFLNEAFPYHKYYLAVQDGMSFTHIENVIKARLFDGVFIGGTKPWKYKNGNRLVQLSHKYGLPVHCGGIGTRKNILWAKSIGIDSVDSGVAMIHPRHLKDVLNIESELLWAA